MEFVREMALNYGDSGFLFKSTDGICLAAWRDVAAAESAGGIYTGVTDATQVEYVDIMGNRRKIPVKNGIFLWSPEKTPGSIFMKEGTFFETVPLLSAKVNGPAAPGRSFELEVDFNNLRDTVSTVEFELQPPEDIQVSQREFSMAVPPGCRSVHVVRVKMNAGAEPEGELIRIPCNFRVEGLDSEFTFIARRAWNGKAGFILDQRHQVVSLYDKVPGHSIWEGPGDLSAIISLHVDGNCLTVSADVTDDIHRQLESGAMIWKGDSIQVFVSPPQAEGIFEFGAALTDHGSIEIAVWSVPQGFRAELLESNMKADVSRNGNVTRYRLKVPLNILGLTPEMIRNGFGFNLLVNDSDIPEDEREGWVRLGPGAGDERKPHRYPVIFFD